MWPRVVEDREPSVREDIGTVRREVGERVEETCGSKAGRALSLSIKELVGSGRIDREKVVKHPLSRQHINDEPIRQAPLVGSSSRSVESLSPIGRQGNKKRSGGKSRRR